MQKFSWTRNMLIHQIENRTYEKYQLNQTNFDQVLPEKYNHQAKLAVKDHYIFDFLELGNEHSENELQTSLIRNIQNFLLEMGNWFAFIGSKYRLKVGGQDFFVDLLLYHRKLQCLIAVELKVGDFKPEYKGKMDFYLTALNELIKEENENDSIGIIICKSKNTTVVEYSLRSGSFPVGVSTYDIVSKLPDKYRKLLPEPAEISKKMDSLKELFSE